MFPKIKKLLDMKSSYDLDLERTWYNYVLCKIVPK